MKCSRCGGRVVGATWYCKHCGASISATSGYGNPAQPRGRRLLWAACALLTAVIAIGAIGGRFLPTNRTASPSPLGDARLAANLPAEQLPTLDWPTPSAVPSSEEAAEVTVQESDSATTLSGSSGSPDANHSPSNQGSSANTGATAPDVASGAYGSATIAAPAPPPASDTNGLGSSGSGQSAAPRAMPTTNPGDQSGGTAGRGTVSDSTATPGAPPPGATIVAGTSRLGGPVWTAGSPPGRVVLDGQLDDWASDAIEVAQVAFGQEHWDGPADLSARGFIAFDSANLYLAVRVTDDVFSQPSSGEDLHLGDSVELQIDTDLAGDFSDVTYSGDDWQIGFSPGDFAGKAPEAYVWRPAGEAAGIRVASRRLPNGYIVEAAIPWRTLRVDPSRVTRLGLAINVSDNDYPTPAQVTMVSSVPARSWDNPASFGTLLLRQATP